MFHVIVVPALAQRTEDEVQRVICATAAHRLSRFVARQPGADGSGYEPSTVSPSEIEITPAALDVIRTAIDLGVVRSLRDLQRITEIGPGERRITVGNLRGLLSRAEVLGVRGALVHAGRTVAERARELQLCEELCRDDLPDFTAWAITELWARQRRRNPVVPSRQMTELSSADWRAAWYVIASFLKPERRRQLYAATGERPDDAIRTARSAAWGKLFPKVKPDDEPYLAFLTGALTVDRGVPHLPLEAPLERPEGTPSESDPGRPPSSS
jgi:hypothetical protein